MIKQILSLILLCGSLQAWELPWKLPKVADLLPPISLSNELRYAQASGLGAFLAAHYLLPRFRISEDEQDSLNRGWRTQEQIETAITARTWVRDLCIGLGTNIISRGYYFFNAIENVYQRATYILLLAHNTSSLLEQFGVIYLEGRELNKAVDIQAVVTHIIAKDPLSKTALHNAVATYKGEENYLIAARNLYASLLKRIKPDHEYYDRAQTGHAFSEKLCLIVRQMIKGIEEHPDYAREKQFGVSTGILSRPLARLGLVGLGAASAFITYALIHDYNMRRRYRRY